MSDQVHPSTKNTDLVGNLGPAQAHLAVMLREGEMHQGHQRGVITSVPDHPPSAVSATALQVTAELLPFL